MLDSTYFELKANNGWEISKFDDEEWSVGRRQVVGRNTVTEPLGH